MKVRDERPYVLRENVAQPYVPEERHDALAKHKCVVLPSNERGDMGGQPPLLHVMLKTLLALPLVRDMPLWTFPRLTLLSCDSCALRIRAKCPTVVKQKLLQRPVTVIEPQLRDLGSAGDRGNFWLDEERQRDLTIVETWVPLAASLLMLVALALLVRIERRARTKAQPPSPVGSPASRAGNPSELDIALDGTATVNAFSARTASDPSVRLQAALRLAPSTYQAGVVELAQHIRDGRVLSVDLSKMDYHAAARTVDFCSGSMSACAGWIFRMADDVIVLTPGKQAGHPK